MFGPVKILSFRLWPVNFADASYTLRALKWKRLADRRDKQMNFLMFKTVNSLVPEFLSDKFASVNTIHRQNLREATQPVYSTAEH